MKQSINITFYSCTHRNIIKILESTHQELYNHYLIDKDVMEDDQRIATLENIVDISQLLKQLWEQKEKEWEGHKDT
jgi:N-acetyl-anhydromuramyl-L-alanine amidase AmpD